MELIDKVRSQVEEIVSKYESSTGLTELLKAKIVNLEAENSAKEQYIKSLEERLAKRDAEMEEIAQKISMALSRQ